jgi:1-acyl-sn-glycerol-3-phosphate acyltransferase
MVWPVVIGLDLVVVLGAPVWLLLGTLVTGAARSSRPLRSVVLVVTFCGLEMATLARVARLARAGASAAEWDAAVRSVVRAAERAMRRALGVRVVVEAGSATAADLASSPGVIVLSRHCGPGDSLLVAWLLVVHYGRSLRIVLRRLLRAEPVIDLAGDDLPFCFVTPGGRRGRDGVRSLATAMSGNDALLLFPEGGGFTRERWEGAVRRLDREGRYAEARRALSRRFTLPPRHGGALAALQAAPDADVLLLAHTGLGARGRDRPWWRVPVDQEFLVRAVRVSADEVPRQDAAAGEWLDDAWARIDRWVEQRSGL